MTRIVTGLLLQQPSKSQTDEMHGPSALQGEFYPKEVTVKPSTDQAGPEEREERGSTDGVVITANASTQAWWEQHCSYSFVRVCTWAEPSSALPGSLLLLCPRVLPIDRS